MKLALIFLSLLTSLSLWFAPQGTQPVICRGKPLPITNIPGPKMEAQPVPLRFGGTRLPSAYVRSFPTDKGFRLVIKTRDEFSDFWKRLTAPVPPGKWVPPVPEIDFSKDLIVVAAMGTRPTSGYGIIIDGACEVDDQVEVFVSSLETTCAPSLQVLTAPADAVRLPQTDLPIVFREIQLTCTEWLELLKRSK